MQGSVSNRQIFFLLCLTLTAYTIINIPKVLAQRAGTGAWLSIWITAAAFSLIAVIIVRLGIMFPGKTLFEYSREIVGKFLSYVFSIFYFLYFLVIFLFLNIQLTSVLKAEFFPRTPQWATLVAGIAVFGCIAYKGIVSVARFFEIIGVVFLFTAVVTHGIMLTQGNVNNILPLFRASEAPRYIAAVKQTAIAFLGVEILTILPMSGENGKKKTATAFFTLIFIGLFYTLVVETCIMMLGIHDIQNYSYALIEAIKLVDSVVLERFDVLYLTVGFAGLIAGVCAVYLALVEYAGKLFPKANRKVLVSVLGVAAIVLSLIAAGMQKAELLFGTVITVSGIIAACAIPAMLLAVAKVRHLGQKTR